ncbi:cytochrome P450 [Pleionea litopenaei]|uniref:Cytochrome P450 n=1 Tax=Pleionea litopenaei TaxID=3070815 RepID=A0AA51RUX0_9GAMM|nr:cytochrome P450 [Pleionea sp. HL-JVS1]WMS88113.1 cytochrome P450 [Pleionea sp. HL-JVS1]
MFSFFKKDKNKLPSIFDIPGPKGKFLIGDAMRFDEDPVGWMLETKPEFGDMVRLDSETVVIHDAGLIEKVCSETNEDYILDNAMTAGKHGRKKLIDGIAEWMQSRKYLGKALNRHVLTQHIGRAGVSLEREVDKRSDQEQDLFDASQNLLGCAVADFVVGADPEFKRIFDAVEEVFWASLNVTDSEETRLPWMPRPIAKRAERLNKELVELLHQVVKRRLAEYPRNEAPRDALDQLIEGMHDAPEEQLVAAVRLMMVTAHGPSGSIFSWCLLRLAEHPEYIEKIREEMDRDAKDILIPSKFPNTHAFLKETMRMHPSNWLMGRTAQRDTMLGGYLIPEDCRILFSPFVLHRDERYWDRPEEFDPERWLTGKAPHKENAYIPFGSGPRICPGALLGPIQLMLGLRALLSRYELILPPLETALPMHSTLLRPDNVKCRWVLRENLQKQAV